jgi:hypothetical protein
LDLLAHPQIILLNEVNNDEVFYNSKIHIKMIGFEGTECIEGSGIKASIVLLSSG